MNLILIPFHDWRKSESEGFRTRDVHFIQAFSRLKPEVNRILVVNRPHTWLEFLYKGMKRNLRGKLVLKHRNFTLTDVGNGIYVADYYSRDFIGQLLKKHKWFMERYGDERYIRFLERCKEELEIQDSALICQNVFGYRAAIKIKSEVKIMDAWDNFLKFPSYQYIKEPLNKAYSHLADRIPIWITNSEENINFYRMRFEVKDITLVKNGVKTNFVPTNKEVPEDIINLPRPIIGFGGKITYLLNQDLINFITADHPEKSFVFVGQILDKEVYHKIEKRTNVFFLGDKHYSVYPSYVSQFDICIIPYNTGDNQHGGDSIKAYEYLLTGKKVVGTSGNGLLDLKEHLYLEDTEAEFSEQLGDIINNKPPIDIDKHSWESKARTLLNRINKEMN